MGGADECFVKSWCPTIASNATNCRYRPPNGHPVSCRAESKTISCWIFIFSSVIATLLSTIGNSQAETPESGTTPKQWRVIWNDDPATKATLSWSTSEEGDSHLVHVRKESEKQSKETVCQRSGQFSGKLKEGKLFYHHTELTDLVPDTKYFVTFESDGKRSPELNFITAPSRDVSLSILFGGDSRSGQVMRHKMNRQMAAMAKAAEDDKRPRIYALAHGGDYIRNGRDLGQWSVWMTDHELTVGKDGRMLPIIPARGNHDWGPIFNEVFAFPVDDKNFYATSIGPKVRLVTLNTEASAGGDQQQWLTNELKTNRKKNRWVFTQYHRPAFPAVKTPSAALSFWVPIFEKYNVDLVCEADGHCIKRTAPIRNQKIDPTGVIYIGEGGLGVGQRKPKSNRWFIREPDGKTGSDHHVQLITFSQKQMTIRVILYGGKVFDEFHRSPRELSNNEN